MKTLVQYILEKQGIFNGCEDIANELTSQIIDKVYNYKINEYNRLKFSFDASKYNPIFKNEIVIDIAFTSKLDAYRILANTSIDDDKEFEYEHGRLILNDVEANDLRSKPFKIEIDCNDEKINIYDLKSILMHELTHFYAAIIFYNKKDNFFNINYSSPDDWNDQSQKLLYYIQSEEVNAFVAELKGELDKIKKMGFDNILNELKNIDKFKEIIKFKDLFDVYWIDFDFEEVGLAKYPKLYNKEKNTNLSDKKIFELTKKTINKAYNQLYKNAIKMIYEYKGDEDFVKDNFDNGEFIIYKYLSKYRTHRSRK